MGGQAKTKSARVINGGVEGKGREEVREREEGCRTRWRMRGRATGPAGRRACRRQSALTDGDADSPGRTLARLHH